MWLSVPAEHELEHLLAVGTSRPTAGSSRRQRLAALDIPIEQLAARISSVLETVATDPAAAPTLAYQLTSRRYDLGALIDSIRRDTLERDALLIKLGSEGQFVADDRAFLEKRLQQIAEDLTAQRATWRKSLPNVEVTVQNELDSFQLTTARAWRRIVSTFAIAIAGAVGLTLSAIFQQHVLVVTTVLAVVMGGYLSWVIRDLTAGLERWRQRP